MRSIRRGRSSWRTSRRALAGVERGGAGARDLKEAVRRSSRSPLPRENRTSSTRRSPPCWCAAPVGTCRETNLKVEGTRWAGALARLRALLLPQREGEAGSGDGALLLPAQVSRTSRRGFWNDVFVFARKKLGIPRGSVGPRSGGDAAAAFEMEENPLRAPRPFQRPEPPAAGITSSH